MFEKRSISRMEKPGDSAEESQTSSCMCMWGEGSAVIHRIIQFGRGPWKMVLSSCLLQAGSAVRSDHGTWDTVQSGLENVQAQRQCWLWTDCSIAFLSSGCKSLSWYPGFKVILVCCMLEFGKALWEQLVSGSDLSNNHSALVFVWVGSSLLRHGTERLSLCFVFSSGW